MVMTTIAWPAAAASMVRLAVRIPAKVEVATETTITCVAAAARVELETGAKVTAASSTDPVQESDCPPMLLMVTSCGGGVSPACALKCRVSGVTASFPGGGGGGGAEVKVIETGTTTLPAAPASKVMVALRVPAAACAATLTDSVLVPLAASVPVESESVTVGSDEAADQVRLDPPSLSNESGCAGGAAGALAAVDGGGSASPALTRV